jgi:hypothetical protein
MVKNFPNVMEGMRKILEIWIYTFNIWINLN